MIIFGYEINKYRSREEQEDACRAAFRRNCRKTLYEHQPIGNRGYRLLGWRVVGYSGRWLLIGSDSPYAHGCIKKPNFKELTEVCDTTPYRCYRFISPSKIGTFLHQL